MKRNQRQSNAVPPPVEHIDVPTERTRTRAIAAVLLLIIGLAAIGFGVHSALTRKSGWTEVEALSGSPGCAQEFRLQYRLPDKKGTTVYRALSALYTTACSRAAQVYSAAETFDGVGNVCAINDHVNETVTVEPELYAALEKLQAAGCRVPYLAPIYETYSGLFFCETDEETAAYDPLQNAEIVALFQEIAAFANDSTAIDLALLGDNRVRLEASDAYLQYADKIGAERLFDLGWMKNAFIADDLADALLAEGFSDGYLQSYDGYGRNLSESGEAFRLSVFDRVGVPAAELEYTRPLAYVSLHSYPVSSGETDRYYTFADGAVRSIWIDPADGQPKTAISDLLVWSDQLGCGELVLTAAQTFVSERFEPSLIAAPQMFCAYCEDQTVICTDPTVTFPEIAEGYRLRQAS